MINRFVALSVAAALLTVGAGGASAQTLVGFASLPADTFAAGPTSGQVGIAPTNGRIPPFPDPPVQGFSSVLRTSNGEFLAMPDNGFGAKNNSPDYVLRFYRVAPDFRTRTGGTGTIAVKSFVTLSDPYNYIPFPVVADMATYPGSAIPVDPAIVNGRLLTGGDFDIESFRRAHDGTFWFGDEFGPFLLHTDAEGRLLEPPYPLAGVMSPQNPNLNGAAPTLPPSRGFEGMAITNDGKTLLPLLEGALIGEADQRRLILNEFDIASRRYTGQQWFYRLEQPAHAIGDFTAVTDRLFLVIERDNLQGAAAQFKKIYLVNLDDVENGFLVKHEVVNLLNIADPDNLGGFGATFRFPFQTIESVIPLSQREIGVLDDNNYPFSSARVPGQPDPNEFILIRLDQPLTLHAKP